jgi:hypothetical protein
VNNIQQSFEFLDLNLISLSRSNIMLIVLNAQNEDLLVTKFFWSTISLYFFSTKFIIYMPLCVGIVYNNDNSGQYLLINIHFYNKLF